MEIYFELNNSNCERGTSVKKSENRIDNFEFSRTAFQL